MQNPRVKRRSKANLAKGVGDSNLDLYPNCQAERSGHQVSLQLPSLSPGLPGYPSGSAILRMAWGGGGVEWGSLGGD